MIVDIKENRKLVMKNARIGKNENGDVMVVEEDKDGNISSNNLLEVISEVFGDESFDVTITMKREI